MVPFLCAHGISSIKFFIKLNEICTWTIPQLFPIVTSGMLVFLSSEWPLWNHSVVAQCIYSHPLLPQQIAILFISLLSASQANYLTIVTQFRISYMCNWHWVGYWVRNENYLKRARWLDFMWNQTFTAVCIIRCAISIYSMVSYVQRFKKKSTGITLCSTINVFLDLSL